jgi:predicted membrane chloride channel (bestrophin family)
VPLCAVVLTFPVFIPVVLAADGSVELLLKPKDLRHARGASSMPMYCIQELMSMIALYSTDAVSANVKKAMNQAVHNLIAPFTEAERIKSNPVAFAYIAHLRLLLCIYLAALPLALVESLGWSTIPVFMVISYALLSLEVIGRLSWTTCIPPCLLRSRGVLTE